MPHINSIVKDFLKGAFYTGSGCRSFYSDRKAWKYALFPFGIILLFYIAVFAGSLYLSVKTADAALSLLENLPQWLEWLKYAVSPVTGILFTILFIIMATQTFCALYELSGGVFFDALAEYHQMKKYNIKPMALSLSCKMKWGFDALKFALSTAVQLAVLFVVSLIFPIIGQILFILCAGYYIGFSCMMSSAGSRGYQLDDLRKAAKKRIFLILGFGTTAYLIMMIPFAAVIMLPGIVTGGTELFVEEISDC